MRVIQASLITNKIKTMCMNANYDLPDDVKTRIINCREEEPWDIAKGILDQILDNVEFAGAERLPLCQDTGMACIFIELGQEVHIDGGSLYQAVNEGVKQGYEAGFLRKSMVEDPLRRVNTNTNLPAFIHTELVEGDRLKLVLAPKGAGSENMSRVKMCKPSDGAEGVTDFVLETIKLAGPNPCPPIVVGVGIGGSFDRVTLLAKQALLRPLNEQHKDPFYADMEQYLLEKINSLGIGPQGFGGRTTALKVNIEACPTHIACLPVAVNINCHVTRHVQEII